MLETFLLGIPVHCFVLCIRKHLSRVLALASRNWGASKWMVTLFKMFPWHLATWVTPPVRATWIWHNAAFRWHLRVAEMLPWLWAVGAQGSQPLDTLCWGWKEKCWSEAGRDPNYSFTRQALCLWKDGVQSISPEAQSVQPVPGEVWLSYITLEGLCPSLWAHRYRRKLNL